MTSRSPKKVDVALAAALVAIAVSGCGGQKAAPAKPAPPAVDHAVRQLFASYTRAVGNQDWPKACSYLAPESITRMQRDAAKFLDNPPKGCAALWGFLARTASRSGQARVAQVTRTARIRRVVMTDSGPEIRWTATVKGRRVPVTQHVRRVGGVYKLVSVTRTP